MSETEELKSRPGILKRIGISILILLAALLSISLIVQIPAVQNWGVGYITRYLTKETGSAVEVGAFSLNVFSQVTLKDIYISQYASPTDTLIYAGELGVSFSRIWKLFGKEPDIKRLKLRQAKLYIDDTPLNLFTSKKPNSSWGFVLRDAEIILDDVEVRVEKSSSPVKMHYVLPRGAVQIDNIDSEARELKIRTISLGGPVVHLIRGQSDEDSLGDKTEPSETDATDSRVRQEWMITAREIRIAKGQVAYRDSRERTALSGGVDYHNLGISQLEARTTDVQWRGDTLSGTINGISFHEQAGFILDQIGARTFRITPSEVAFGGLEIITPETVITDSLVLKFPLPDEMDSGSDGVELYFRSRDSRVAIADLVMAIPGLGSSEVFQKNHDEVLHISGVVRGTPERLRGDSLNVRIGNMTFTGLFRSRNLMTPGKQVLNLVVDDASFTPFDLADHIPGVRIQEQFRTLGTVRFQGKFDGFLNDFVAYGKLATAIGKAEVDMNLVTTGEIARYSGAISLDKFNLKKWTGADDLGLVSARLQLEDGVGLSAETASARITGKILQFQYKGYNYADVIIDGKLNQNQFDGRMEVRDQNINMVFQGNVRATGDVPEYDFRADVAHLDLKKLNLAKDTLTISGQIAAQGMGKDFNGLIGSVQASGVRIHQSGGYDYALDTLYVDIKKLDSGERYIETRSDYIAGWLKGTFEVNAIYPSVARYLEETYPQYFSDLNYKHDLSEHKPQMSFDVVLNKPEDWGGLFHLRDTRFHDLQIAGVMDLAQDSVFIDINAPDLHYGNVNIYRLGAHIESISGQATAETSIAAIDVNEDYFFDEITASVKTSDYGFTWSLAADDLLEELNTLDLSGRFVMDSTRTYTLFLDPEILEVLDQSWELREGNRIRWGKGFIELRDIVFENGDQVIKISDVNKKGVMIETQAFDFGVIDVLWDYDNLDFSGPYTLRAGVSDIFRMDNFYLTVDAPDIVINGDSYGTLRLDSRMDKAGNPVKLVADLRKAGVRASARGEYYPPLDEVKPQLRNTMDLRIETDTFPIAFLEYFIGDPIKNTVGHLQGLLHIHGPLGKVEMDGSARIHDAATTIVYLGTRYFLDDQTLTINETFIDATGAVISDEYGNTATMQGGLTHRALARLGLRLQITSPRIMAMNTTRADNSTYYGKGIGSLDARFSGYVDRPTISVNSVTSEGTYIVINLADAESTRRRSFVRFRDDEEVVAGSLSSRTTITGLNFDMNLTATPAAVVEIKLEENPPESIIGSGSGNVQMSISRTGDFSMYGEYEIEEGDYLFRSFVIINKPFKLRRGGTIRWNGEPYDAEINIEADYSGLRASVSTLLGEYLVNASVDANEEARRKTDVELKLLLTGTLLEPEINFDLSFPNLSGELAGYADTKLRVLKSNQNAMNEQVFGLLWAGAFLPSNVLQSNSSLALAGEGITNSVSEFLSSQVSSLFSSVISRWVEDVDFISNIDFDVGYTRGSQFDPQDVNGISQGYEEWEVRVQPRLLNDRILIDAGANYGTGTAIGQGAYFVGDYALEYLLTRDGRLKIRFYYRNDPQTIEGRKSKYGIGLAWRREFDSFDEWLGGLKKEAKGLRDGTGSEINQ